MIKKKFLFIISLFLLVAMGVAGQGGKPRFAVPFPFDLYLSGNFAELRSNHFHAGLDFKTQGVEGKPIAVVADGYICRVKVQAGGYGRALYVMHDNGFMTVYGHLQKFPAEVERVVRAEQYATENFPVDISFEKGKFPVKKGEVLAHAGNTGYSFGPHLHFEVRSACGEELYNPMQFYGSKIVDKRPPVAQAVAIYPVEGRGAVCGTASSVVCKVQGGVVADTLTAWGAVGFGIKGLDYMSGTHNKYGIYEIELLVDDSLRFSARMDNFSYSENRLINAWADYGRLQAGDGWFLRSYILPNNPLRLLKADAAGGIVDICEERPYKVEYRLRDYHGNSSVCSFVVVGEPCEIATNEKHGGNMLRWYLNNSVYSAGYSLSVPRGALFEDCYFVLSVDSLAHSPVYRLKGAPVPLWKAARVTLDIPASLVPFASKCYIARVNGTKRSAVGGEVSGSVISAGIYTLADYMVAVDTVAPKVREVGEKNWARNGHVVFALSDKETGISSYRGTIDGEWVLFEYSSKSGRLTCDFRREKVARGTHQLCVVVCDKVGNETVVEKTIKY